MGWFYESAREAFKIMGMVQLLCAYRTSISKFILCVDCLNFLFFSYGGYSINDQLTKSMEILNGSDDGV
jgi:hypothetical protein